MPIQNAPKAEQPHPIIIDFPASKSAALPDAIEKLAAADGSETTERNGVPVRYHAEYSFSKAEQAVALLKLVGNWKGSELRIKGRVRHAYLAIPTLDCLATWLTLGGKARRKHCYRVEDDMVTGSCRRMLDDYTSDTSYEELSSRFEAEAARTCVDWCPALKRPAVLLIKEDKGKLDAFARKLTEKLTDELDVDEWEDAGDF